MRPHTRHYLSKIVFPWLIEGGDRVEKCTGINKYLVLGAHSSKDTLKRRF